MKFALIFAACMALATGLVVPKKLNAGVSYADQEFLQKQKFILDVLDNIHQPLKDPKYLQDVSAYVTGPEFYTNYPEVQEFFEIYQRGVLPQNYVYSILEEQQLKETIALFKLFYYAKDWPTFYRNVLWARQNMNEGMFIYALSVAVVHRKDMEGIVLPALQEIEPYMFFTGETMSAASNLQVTDFAKTNYIYTILANYTSDIEQTNDDSKLAYFTEDIGWNAFNYYFHIDYPFWMGGKEFNLYKDRRGELYLYWHQQILARYYMERLSQNIGPIPKFSWLKPIKTGYNPHLRYYNGLEFAVRKDLYDVTANGDYDTLSLVQDYERRVRDIIDLGYYNLPSGEQIDLRNPKSVEFLGNMIQANPDSAEKQFIDYMTLLARVLLSGGKYKTSYDYKVQPSVLEHFETAMRDPVFYQLYNRVLMYYSQFKDYLQPYTYEELLTPGVNIQNVRVTPLITYFDYFTSDITNGVNIADSTGSDISDSMKQIKKNIVPTDSPITKQQQAEYTILAKQKRLNHKPFIVNIDVLATVPQTVAVRIFLGPKLNIFRNIISLTENRDNFVQLDQFVYNLPVGNVTIKRASNDFFWSVKSRTTYTELYQKVMMGLNGTSPFVLDMSEAHCGFPDRLLLPKGWIAGMTMQVYVIITPYTANTSARQFSTYDHTRTCGIGSGTRYLDDLPLSYPFDRAIDEIAFTTPNMFFKDVIIYHAPKSNMVNMNMAEGWIPFEKIPTMSALTADGKIPDFSAFIPAGKIPDFTAFIPAGKIPDFSTFIPDLSTLIPAGKIPAGKIPAGKIPAHITPFIPSFKFNTSNVPNST